MLIEKESWFFAVCFVSSVPSEMNFISAWVILKRETHLEFHWTVCSIVGRVDWFVDFVFFLLIISSSFLQYFHIGHNQISCRNFDNIARHFYVFIEHWTPVRHVFRMNIVFFFCEHWSVIHFTSFFFFWIFVLFLFLFA